MLRALEVVREAPTNAKESAAQNLATTPCSQPVICAARDHCARVYDHFAKGMAAQARVRDALELLEHSPPNDTGRVQDLAGELHRAEVEVNDAQTGLSECERAASLMRRAYGI